MRINKAAAEGKRVYVLVDMGRVVAGCWTVEREAQAEANSRNDLPDVVAVNVVDGKFRVAALAEVG
jgi:hypothetical protein